MLHDCCCGESGPGDELSVLYCFVPCWLHWESCSGVEVPNKLRLCLQFVDVVDSFRWQGAVREILAGGSLDEQGIGVVVADDGYERNAP